MKSPVQPDTKQACILGMLRARAGTTIAAIMAATEWQSTRYVAFLLAVRKKLGLKLVSEPTDKGRVYRIKDGASPAASSRTKQAA